MWQLRSHQARKSEPERESLMTSFMRDRARWESLETAGPLPEPCTQEVSIKQPSFFSIQCAWTTTGTVSGTPALRAWTNWAWLGFWRARIALSAVLFPLPFGPTMSVNRPSGSVALRSALKLLNSMDSIIHATQRAKPSAAPLKIQRFRAGQCRWTRPLSEPRALGLSWPSRNLAKDGFGRLYSR